MSVSDTGPVVRKAGQALSGQGWSVREEPVARGRVHLVAEKAGARIVLTGGSGEPRTVLLTAFSACVA
ncbi:MAG TPA: hypothetical protein VFP72_00995 [Kineosporiaceae bacterium]|nr:hypothetical protein [Kineosporiaceae bacterium]